MANSTSAGEGSPVTLLPFHGSGIGVSKLSVGRTTWTHHFQNCFPQPSNVILMALAITQGPREHLQVILSYGHSLRQVDSIEGILKCGPWASSSSSVQEDGKLAGPQLFNQNPWGQGPASCENKYSRGFQWAQGSKKHDCKRTQLVRWP